MERLRFCPNQRESATEATQRIGVRAAPILCAPRDCRASLRAMIPVTLQIDPETLAKFQAAQEELVVWLGFEPPNE